MAALARDAARMIEVRITPDPRSLAGRLALRASARAAALAEERLRAARADPSRWRLPRLLWPLFTKG